MVARIAVEENDAASKIPHFHRRAESRLGFLKMKDFLLDRLSLIEGEII